MEKLLARCQVKLFVKWIKQNHKIMSLHWYKQEFSADLNPDCLFIVGHCRVLIEINEKHVS
ncbi:MAG: hypothetical protein O7D86_05115 [Proteobacteria bacterium]|nr:hypothetical protein [Pseudomonadota bacterium]